MSRLLLSVLGLMLALMLPSSIRSALAAPPALDDFLRRESFEAIKLSPDGRYLAATVPLEGHNALVILGREDLQRLATAVMPRRSYVDDFWWADGERLVFAVAERTGTLDAPQLTGELFALDATGKQPAQALAGQRAHSEMVGSQIKRADQMVFVQLIDLLRNDPNHVLVSVWGATSFSTVERLNVHNGKRSRVARAPIARAWFRADPNGEVRFAGANDAGNRQHVFLRDGAEWREINDENQSGRRLTPVGFNAAGTLAYLQVSQPFGPDALVSYDLASGVETPVVVDGKVSPNDYFEAPDDGALYAVRFLDQTARLHYVDPDHRFAKQHAALAASLPGQLVQPSSYSRDGRFALYVAMSDRNPGDYYLLDAEQKSAKLLLSRAEWLYPDDLASTAAIEFTARDGLTIPGFLTRPKDAGSGPLPLIVNPHGGPFGIADSWLYQEERQLLASRGYAVLQVNFRGSGNYGAEFVTKGYRQWGGRMQDDLTDATRWAIEQGIADPQRICIYGASYGGYAALMGAAKEPELYRCAAGNVGVYDLPLMHKRGDIQSVHWGRNQLEEILGTEGLQALSPTHLAERIRAGVFLAAGAEDERAPPIHTERMRDALKGAGRKVESIIYEREGHGYFNQDTRRDYYTRLLAFFDRHLAASAPTEAAP